MNVDNFDGGGFVDQPSIIYTFNESMQIFDRKCHISNENITP